MGPRGPRAYGLRPRLWLLIEDKVNLAGKPVVEVRPALCPARGVTRDVEWRGRAHISSWSLILVSAVSAVCIGPGDNKRFTLRQEVRKLYLLSNHCV